MSVFASLLRCVYRLSGAKKAFCLPEDEITKVIEKQNRNRGVFTPTDCKAYYETIDVNGFPCLIVRENEKPSERAILYFFGGGMVIGPDKGDLPVIRKLMRDTGCDVWFPFYPLCTEHCITDTYDMVYECYRRMIGIYGGGNVSTCGFSSGGALALGIACLIYLNKIHEKEIATKLQKDISFGMTVYSGLAGGIIGIFQIVYIGASSELVWIVFGGFLNFASGLPIYLSFRKGIFYGVK